MPRQSKEKKVINGVGTGRRPAPARGGDAYSAPAVYVKEAGLWKIYYICRDYLGSITHITNADGSLKAEYSYDAWGRLRNLVTQEAYAPGSEPVLFIGRGYTGHEHLPWFGLINMNARLYDPALGRFLSPDPYVQAPDFSQSFNRYSYCLNNPLRYVDKNGEMPWYVAAGIVAVFMYLKTAHDMTPPEKSKGNPANWQWNPIKWFDTKPGQPIPTVEIGVNSGFDGRGAQIGLSVGYPGQPMPSVGYSSYYGWGLGYNQNGNYDMYYPKYNYNAPQQAVIKAEANARLLYIDNTENALQHYLFGDGSPVNIGNNTLNALKNSSEFKANLQSFITGKNEKYEGCFSIDMTKTVFHIGRTTVNYRLENINGQSKLTYNAFVNDGFWDPDFIDERYGKYFANPNSFVPDGMGPNLERFGGKPYRYIPRQFIFYFP